MLKDKKRNPRGRSQPTSICVNCKHPVTFSWDKENVPFWRHTGGNCKLSDSQKETMTHNLAKELLAKYLRSGCRINIIHSCPHSKPRIYSLKGEQTAVTEWKYGRARFDVACTGGDLPPFGIEIRKSHATDNLVARESIDWIELDAVEVLNVLDYQCPNHTVIVRNTRALCVDPGCLTCKPFQSLITELGILHVTERVFQGNTIVDEIWTIVFPEDIKDSLWNEFIIRSKCAHCKRMRKKKFEINKPYCDKCKAKVIASSEDGGLTGYMVNFEEQEATREYGVNTFLNKVFTGVIVLSADEVRIRKRGQPKTRLFTPTSSIHKFYLGWSGRTKEDISVKKMKTIMQKEYADSLLYVGHVTIDSESEWGFHILESVWARTLFARHLYYYNAEGKREFKVDTITLEEYAAEADDE